MVRGSALRPKIPCSQNPLFFCFLVPCSFFPCSFFPLFFCSLVLVLVLVPVLVLLPKPIQIQLCRHGGVVFEEVDEVGEAIRDVHHALGAKTIE